MSTAGRPIPRTNRQFKLAARPVGLPKESDFTLVEAQIPSLAQGQALVKTVYLSVDPYMRGRITGVRTYADPVNIGDVMEAGAVGQVVESKAGELASGDFVMGRWGWQEYAAVDPKSCAEARPEARARLNRSRRARYAWNDGVLRLPRHLQTATGRNRFGLGCGRRCWFAGGTDRKNQRLPRGGDRRHGPKIDWLVQELGFDAAFNYKTTADYAAKLKELCPNGIDCYFDNVGGSTTDAVFPCMNTFGRVSVCGQISQYNLAKPEPGLRLLPYVLIKQLKVEGFIVTRFQSRFGEGIPQMAQWMKEGKLKYREQIVEGFENTPRAFIGMLQGENTGKMLVKV